MKIEELTPEQEAQIQVYYDEWYKIGTCTEPADRATAEKAVVGMLKEAGRYNNQQIIWCNSPMVAELLINILSDKEIGASLKASLKDLLGVSLMDSLLESLKDSLTDSLGDSLKASLYDSLWDSLLESLRTSLWDSLGDSIRTSILSSIGDSLTDSIGEPIGNSLEDLLGASIGVSLMASVRTSLWNSLEDLLGNSLMASVKDSLWDSLDYSIGVSLMASVKDSLKKNSLKYTGTWFDGHLDAYWICFYKFCRDVVGVKYEEERNRQLDLQVDLCKSAGRVYFFEDKVIICERPKVLKFENRRLHCEDGMAVQYRDGWGLYAIEGVLVPAWVFEQPELLTIEKIQNEKNLELQRVLIHRYGVDKYLTDTGADVVDVDMRGIEGGGARCLLRDKGGQQWLVCTDGSTERVYHLAVSNNAKTCKQAHEELCGFKETLIKMEG